MSKIFRGAGLLPMLALTLGAGARGAATAGQAAPATPQDRLYACQMRGAEAEDRVYGPLGDLSIDSAMVRSQVTQDCLQGRQSPVVVGRPGLR
jgi:hypothetical protein